MGEMLAQTERAKGGQPYHKVSTRIHGEQVETPLSELGLSRKEASEAQVLANLSPAREDTLRHEGETNANYLAKRYEAEWNIRLDSDPVTAEVFNSINKRPSGTLPAKMVSGKPTTAQGGTETSVQRNLVPATSEGTDLLGLIRAHARGVAGSFRTP